MEPWGSTETKQLQALTLRSTDRPSESILACDPCRKQASRHTCTPSGSGTYDRKEQEYSCENYAAVGHSVAH
jgi:hypothetical protein